MEIVDRFPWSRAPTTNRTSHRSVSSVVNRYYDPATDQFLSIDPDFAMTDQPYVFANDNPLNDTDPLGNLACGVGPATGTCDKVIPGIVSVTIDLSPTANGGVVSAASGQVPTSAVVSVTYRDAFGAVGVTRYVYHYTSASRAKSIEEDGWINVNPQTGKTWVSPDEFNSADDAQNNLSLPSTPGGYFKIPIEDVPGVSEFTTVDPVYPWEGGGLEGTTSDPIPIDPEDGGFIPFPDIP